MQFHVPPRQFIRRLFTFIGKLILLIYYARFVAMSSIQDVHLLVGVAAVTGAGAAFTYTLLYRRQQADDSSPSHPSHSNLPQ